MEISKTSIDATYRATFFSVTPGLSFRLGDRYTLLIGSRITLPFDSDLTPDVVFSSFTQLDFTF
jgi:hypothetical protein